MKASIYDLTYEFIKARMDVNPNISVNEKKEVMRSFTYLLDRGWTAEELMDKMNTMIPVDVPAPEINIIKEFSKFKKTSFNVLKHGEFYWHPQLRVFPAAPQRIWDINSGEIKKIDEPYFLEMKASYTVEELADYYFAQTRKENLNQNEYKRAIGAFKSLIDMHSIDTILFMIDTAANVTIEGDKKPMDTPFKITEHILEARAAMGQKMTEEIQAGDDEIVVRRRVPLGRGRS